jgi:hypothetical protein
MDTKFDGKDVSLMEIPGKYGRILLVIPERKPTSEELQSLHRVIAEVIVNTAKADN